ncbi:MAG: D-alanine--D-alanine ligase [Eubacteriales bacterium]|nr:D-alanine--D-alanine ligase [Eubacteriales bacterium]
MALKTVLVLFGGVSTEHLISLRSAFNIIGGLRRAGLAVQAVGIAKNGDWLAYEGADEAIPDGTWETIAREQAKSRPAYAVRSPREFITQFHGQTPDVVFPAVHGINSEDGTLQGLLELSGLPYVGCGVLASAAGMDKLHAKTIFKAARIPQCRYLAVTRAEIQRNPEAVATRVAAKLGYPCFLKPSNGGSSVGTKRADQYQTLVDALKEVSAFDNVVIIEEFLVAREIEVAVMGNERPKAALIGEVQTNEAVEYYDYEAKYFKADGAQVSVPANLPPEMAAKVRRLALRAYKSLGCRGLSRVDFFLTMKGTAPDQLYLNEVNTLPGFTPISIFPKAFAASGVNLEELVKKLCQYAIAEKKARSRQELI